MMVKTKTTNYVKKQVRVALYVRVSTQEQAKEGYSIKEQIDSALNTGETRYFTVITFDRSYT
jgi:DNA invertase Pin-like site-specific DNA recombinase